MQRRSLRGCAAEKFPHTYELIAAELSKSLAGNPEHSAFSSGRKRFKEEDYDLGASISLHTFYCPVRDSCPPCGCCAQISLALFPGICCALSYAERCASLLSFLPPSTTRRDSTDISRRVVKSNKGARLMCSLWPRRAV